VKLSLLFIKEGGFSHVLLDNAFSFSFKTNRIFSFFNNMLIRENKRKAQCQEERATGHGRQPGVCENESMDRKNHMYIPFLGFFILKKYKFLEWIVSTAYESSDGPPSHMVLQDVKP